MNVLNRTHLGLAHINLLGYVFPKSIASSKNLNLTKTIQRNVFKKG
ncbi:hypothetical protein ISN45_At04g004580 [Arabidopsis thaliana x Arabidopsis arenosa]|uniref:Uncharacterized protein n=1 Tax=Arabidopsis thaliana x Arabidopsis arenosa TaxID=1240361 RepID=A0A8T2DTW3_9BRAS|nr:hypothetical protein ISN45_At04g004580 [Arabidopsis thaliana x Arabidopsis arenosa]